jgi:hypothetical protein
MRVNRNWDPQSDSLISEATVNSMLNEYRAMRQIGVRKVPSQWAYDRDSGLLSYLRGKNVMVHTLGTGPLELQMYPNGNARIEFDQGRVYVQPDRQDPKTLIPLERITKIEFRGCEVSKAETRELIEPLTRADILMEVEPAYR